MAFIVEMIHGSPNKLEIMKSDEDDNLYVGETIPITTGDLDFETFSCSGATWGRLLNLGQEFGWRPLGSVLEKSIGSINPIKGDYTPSSWGEEDYKAFLAEDALAFSDALEAFISQKSGEEDFGKHRPTIITSAMVAKEFEQVISGIDLPFLADFIRFLRKGQFIFVWDD